MLEAMNVYTPIDADALIREMTRYLVAVDTFRAQDCEPTWRPELEPNRDPIVLRIAAYGQAASAAGS